jgi:hypothetical protein
MKTNYQNKMQDSYENKALKIKCSVCGRGIKTVKKGEKPLCGYCKMRGGNK